MKEFKAASRRKDVIEFTIDRDDEVYHFTTQKIAGMLLPLITEEAPKGALVRQVAWLRSGLPEEEYERIVARLGNNDDPFDFDTLDEIIAWLMEECSGRPTT